MRIHPEEEPTATGILTIHKRNPIQRIRANREPPGKCEFIRELGRFCGGLKNMRGHTIQQEAVPLDARRKFDDARKIIRLIAIKSPCGPGRRGLG